MTRDLCALCQQDAFIKLVDFPPTPIANQLLKAAQNSFATQEKFPLDLFMCANCRHIQIGTIVDPNLLFSNYPYVSNTSNAMAERLISLANEYTSRFNISSSHFILEIGSNDGFLLSQFQKLGCDVLGVDPAINATNLAKEAGVPTVVDFFTSDEASRIKSLHKSPKLIIANNVLAHSDCLPDIFAGISLLMDADSIAVIEFSYVVDVFEKLLFDTVYHEHTSYHSIEPLVIFLEKLDLKIIDVERFEAHGGSARIFLAKKESKERVSANVLAARNYELSIGVHELESWSEFRAQIIELGRLMTELIDEIGQKEETLAGYGVPAKFTTLFHTLNIKESALCAIADDNRLKFGNFAPGTFLTIIPSEELPVVDNIIVFSWNYADDIIVKLKKMGKVRKRIIIPLPNFRIIEL